MYGDDIIYKKQEHRGYTCKVVYDPDPISPDDWDTLGTIYANSRNHNPQNHTLDEIMVEDETDDAGMHIDPNYIFIRIYAYEHSGIALHASTSPQRCGWDEYLFGVMAVHKDKAAKEFGDITNVENYEKVMKCLGGEVECWDMYYQGQVFGFEVLDEDDNEVDSCWGFYGYEGAKEAMQEGIGIIDYRVDKKEREEAEEAARIQYYEMITEPFWID